MTATTPYILHPIHHCPMSDPQGIKKHRPGYVIAAGTQVVLQVQKPVLDRDTFRKPGSVGVVVESPSTNDGTYVVRFTNGETIQARFEELALRRQEVENELAHWDVDLRPFVIYQCQVGSKAYGLANDDSDDDYRGIFLPPAHLHWSLYQMPEQIETQQDHLDEVYWEIEKFLRLALKANPNVLETLWTPKVLIQDDTARELRDIRDAFLSRHIYKTYSGYVLSQFRRMANAVKRTGKYKPKHAMHLIRLLIAGISAMREHLILVDVSEHREMLLPIRNGEHSFDEVRKRAFQLDEEFQLAFEQTALPEQPDFTCINDFLVRARSRAVTGS